MLHNPLENTIQVHIKSSLFIIFFYLVDLCHLFLFCYYVVTP